MAIKKTARQDIILTNPIRTEVMQIRYIKIARDALHNYNVVAKISYIGSAFLYNLD